MFHAPTLELVSKYRNKIIRLSKHPIHIVQYYTNFRDFDNEA
jgi:hypothetical protein